MIVAGTVLAPFIGFLRERSALKAQVVTVAKTLMLFGCRNREVNLLYADELRAYQGTGLVEVKNAFSRDPGSRCR